MKPKQYLTDIVSELTSNLKYVDNEQLTYIVESIIKANHIFLAGAGRSGVMNRGFANRLLHLGFSVSVVGDITSPHSKQGDLLIINSGSGETKSLVSLAKKAKENNNVEVSLLTMNTESTIAQVANNVVQLPGVSPKVVDLSDIKSIQPMGSAYEQISMLTYDAIVLDLMNQLGETTDSMFERHADFE